MLKSLAQALMSEGLLCEDESVVVGVSGGPDSMALLHLLVAFNQRLDWHLRIHVAHLNHKLRGADADEDAAFVQAAADDLSLPCTIECTDIAARAKSESLGVEELGRHERYAFLERVCLRVGVDCAAVGHHADDNAETILFRVLRGTGLTGLVGIRRSRPLSSTSDVRLIRPLLHLTRKELRNYLADEGIAFREDCSNRSGEAMRNRIRHVLLPQIEESVNPQVRDALVRLGEQASWVDEYLKETVQRTFETLIISRTDQVLILNAGVLSKKSRIVQTELVRLAYRSFGLGEQDLSFAHMVAALDIISSSISGRKVQLPRGMTLEKRYNQLIVSVPSDQPRESIASQIAIHLPGATLLPVRRLKIECRIVDVVPEEIHRLRRRGSAYREFMDFDAVHPPLVVRKRKDGDRFLPLGAPGSKTLSDFLIDNKVDPQERERIAVLCDQLGPIWIIGHRLDDRVKITAMTKRVLELRAEPLEA